MVLAEPAGTAGTNGNKDVVVLHLFGAFLLGPLHKEPRKVASGEGCGTAGSRVYELLADVKIPSFYVRKRLSPVAHVFQSTLHEPFVLPGKSPKEKGYL